MKRVFQGILFLAGAILLVWILKQAFPKNSGALNFFLFFLLSDAFLWVVTRRETKRLNPFLRYLVAVFYWLPLALVIAGVIYGFFNTFQDWPRFVKTYLTSFVFIAYLSKSVPIGFLFLSLLYQLLVYTLAGLTTRIRFPGWRTRLLLLPGGLLGAAVFLLLLTGMVLWEHHVKVRETTLVIDRLPGSFDGLRIVQLSDLHLGSWNCEPELEKIVRQVNDLQPDLFFFTGDMCDYSTAEVWPFFDILKKIEATYGAYTVLGNHDYGDYMKWPSPEEKAANMLDLYRFYQDLGWRLLNNEHEILVVKGDSLAIIGVENWGVISRFQRLADLPVALSGVENIGIKLLLSHDPSHWDSIVSQQYPEIDITVSGHTHGGQVGIETRQWKWSFVQYLYPEWAGLYQKKWTDGTLQHLYVNRGAGTIGYAGRVGIWAEISLIILQSGRERERVD